MKWTEQALLEIALKYTNSKTFRECEPNAYRAALNKKLISKITAHFIKIPRKKRAPKWTLEQLKEVAGKYLHRGVFQREASAAYQAAYKSGVLDQVCLHMGNCKKGNRAINRTLDEIKSIALQYQTRADFQKAEGGAYKNAEQRHCMAEVCKHMPVLGKPKGSSKWTLEILQQEASKYPSRRAFKEGNLAAYSSANKQGLMATICQHMQGLGNVYRRCLYELQRGNTRYVGITCDFDRRVVEHVRGQTLGPEGFTAVKLTSYLPTLEAIKLERQLIMINTQSKDILSVNIATGGQIGCIGV